MTYIVTSSLESYKIIPSTWNGNPNRINRTFNSTCQSFLPKCCLFPDRRQIFHTDNNIHVLSGTRMSSTWAQGMHCHQNDHHERLADQRWWSRMQKFKCPLLERHLKAISRKSCGNSMEQGPSWELNGCSDIQGIPTILQKQNAHYRLHKSSALLPTRSQMIPL